jgi:Icc-related predicted phosphoesterase
LDEYHEMITSAWTNLTPWHSPRETSDEKLSGIYDRMITRVQRMENCVFCMHVPPYNTEMDLAPELDSTLKPVVRGGGMNMIHVGSTAVRSAIEKHQPLLSLHGHIHESRGFTEIGRTLCVNPGSEYGEGILRGAIINLDERKVKSYILTQG